MDRASTEQHSRRRRGVGHCMMLVLVVLLLSAAATITIAYVGRGSVQTGDVEASANFALSSNREGEAEEISVLTNEPGQLGVFARRLLRLAFYLATLVSLVTASLCFGLVLVGRAAFARSLLLTSSVLAHLSHAYSCLPPIVRLSVHHGAILLFSLSTRAILTGERAIRLALVPLVGLHRPTGRMYSLANLPDTSFEGVSVGALASARTTHAVPLAMATASKLAYEHPDIVQYECRRWGFDRITTLCADHASVRGYVATSTEERVSVVVFGGTRVMDLRNILADMRMDMHKLPIGHVHRGFATALGIHAEVLDQVIHTGADRPVGLLASTKADDTTTPHKDDQNVASLFGGEEGVVGALFPLEEDTAPMPRASSILRFLTRWNIKVLAAGLAWTLLYGLIARFGESQTEETEEGLLGRLRTRVSTLKEPQRPRKRRLLATLSSEQDAEGNHKHITLYRQIIGTLLAHGAFERDPRRSSKLRARYRLYTTGHSLGGALAGLFAAVIRVDPDLGVIATASPNISPSSQLTRDVSTLESSSTLLQSSLTNTSDQQMCPRLYTFGAPKVGDQEFVHFCQTIGLLPHTHRFVLANDIVPHLPVTLPNWILNRDVAKENYLAGTFAGISPAGLPYMHVGTPISLGPSGIITKLSWRDPSFWVRLLDRFLPFLQLEALLHIREATPLRVFLRLFVPFFLNDHLPGDYCSALQRHFRLHPTSTSPSTILLE